MKKILLLLLLSSTPFYSQIPNYVPTNGLIGWYPFNGNANDESGNNNNGTINGAVLTTDRYNTPNSAYSFNFNSITFNNSIITSYPFSISGWFKKEGIGSGYLNYGTLFTTSNIIQATNGNGIHAIINEDTFAIEKSPNTQFELYKNNLDYLNWHHFTITCEVNTSSATLTSKLYINGAITDTQVTALVSYTSSLPFTIGRGFDASIDYSFIGKIDDLGVWNRTLTDNEVLNLYSSTLSNNIFNNSSRINTYPNPVNEILNLNFPNNVIIERLTIYDITGKNIFEIKEVLNNQIDVTSLEKGIYILDIKTQNAILKEKFIKN